MLGKDTDYEMVGVDNLDPNWAVKVKTGDFEGVIIHYEKIAFEPNEDTGTLELTFTYNIVSGHHIIQSADENDIREYFGELLVAVIDTEMKNGTADFEQQE